MEIDPALAEVLEESRRLGFLGPGPIADHVAHAMRVVPLLDELLPAEARCVDLGSGGGVPGLVLAVVRPRWRWMLLDAQLRRTDALVAAVQRLDLVDRVEVVRSRAELAGRDPRWRGRHDAVVARSFGPPAVTAECAAPLLAVGGVLVVSEPPSGELVTAVRWPDDGLATLGLDPVGPAAERRIGWSAFRLVAPMSERFPRSDGRPAKRPLWTDVGS